MLKLQLVVLVEGSLVAEAVAVAVAEQKPKEKKRLEVREEVEVAVLVVKVLDIINQRLMVPKEVLVMKCHH